MHGEYFSGEKGLKLRTSNVVNTLSQSRIKRLNQSYQGKVGNTRMEYARYGPEKVVSNHLKLFLSNL